MIRSPYATKFTQEQQAGHKNPTRDMTNRKPPKKPKKEGEK